MGRLETELLGLQIVALDDASIVGEVDGLIVDDASMKIAGFLVDLGLYEARVLPFDQVVAIGEDAVVIGTGSAVRRITSEPRLENLARKEVTISFARAITTSGRSVGTVGDFVVDTDTGDLVGIEILPGTEGDDPTPRAMFVGTSGIRRLGKEVVVLHEDVERHLVAMPTAPATHDHATEAVEGMTAPAEEALDETEDRLEDTVTDVPVPDLGAPSSADEEPPLEGAASEAAVPLSAVPATPEPRAVSEPEGTSPEPTADTAAPEAPPVPETKVDAVAPESSAEEQPRHFLLGKRVLRRIEDPEGRLIAEAGDTVSYEMIQQAKASDQLLILSLNVE